MTGLKTWFEGRSLRERRLLLVMAALAVLTVLWGLIIRPVGDGLSSARGRHADAVTRLGETRAQVATLRDIQRTRATPLTGTLADVVRAEADQAGFALASLDQDGSSRVRIGIQSALASGANTEFVFGRNEPGNQMFHQWVDDLVDSTPVTTRKGH